MSNQNATTLPVTVKVVRECAKQSLNNQRRLLDTKMCGIVARLNEAANEHNSSRFTKLFRLEQKPLLDANETVEKWKLDWKAGNVTSEHVAYYTLSFASTPWWKRLKQFEELPEADDEKMMQVSAGDLDLIEYNHWSKFV